jgi:hypothetical protein
MLPRNVGLKTHNTKITAAERAMAEMLLSTGNYEYFIDEKSITESLVATFQSSRIHRSKIIAPQSN